MKGFAALPGLLRLYVWNCRLDISRNMAYRFNFIVGTFISLLNAGVAPIVQLLIFTTTNGYPGWSVPQLVLFQGVLLFWNGMRTMLFGRVFYETMSLVRKGDFDRLLVKPYPPMGVLLASGFQLSGAAPSLAGAVIIGWSLAKLDVVWHWWTLPLFVVLLLAGLCLYMALLILLCSIIIVIVQMGRLGEMFEKVVSFSDYPMSIYPRALRLFFSIALPFAVWINFPAQALLNRLDTAMIWGSLASVALLLVANQLWRLGLNKYTSAGG